MSPDVSWIAMAMIPATGVGVVIALVYATIALWQAVCTSGEHRTFYLLLAAHLAEPLITLPWLSYMLGFAGGSKPILDWFAWMLLGTAPMIVLLVPRFMGWNNFDLRFAAQRLANLGAARYAGSLLCIVTFGIGQIVSYVPHGIVTLVGTAVLFWCIRSAHRTLWNLRHRAVQVSL
jgi:hypothetical protein